MDKISFKNQTGRIAPEVVIQTSESTKRALLKSLYNEAQINGRDLILKDVELEDGYFIKSMIFGLGDDSKQTNVTLNSIFPTFFMPGRVYQIIILENTTNNPVDVICGTIQGGSDLFNDTVPANGITPILITKAVVTMTPLFISSDNWNGASVNISSISKVIPS
jgi:hypothetical protein